MRVTRIYLGRDGVINIVSGWELEVSGIESGWGEIFYIHVTGSGAHPAFCTIRGELSYLGPLDSENISAPYFKQCFFRGGVITPQTESNTTPPSPKTEITNILYILNFASIIKFKM